MVSYWSGGGFFPVVQTGECCPSDHHQQTTAVLGYTRCLKCMAESHPQYRVCTKIDLILIFTLGMIEETSHWICVGWPEFIREIWSFLRNWINWRGPNMRLTVATEASCSCARFLCARRQQIPCTTETMQAIHCSLHLPPWANAQTAKLCLVWELSTFTSTFNSLEMSSSVQSKLSLQTELAVVRWISLLCPLKQSRLFLRERVFSIQYVWVHTYNCTLGGRTYSLDYNWDHRESSYLKRIDSPNRL